MNHFCMYCENLLYTEIENDELVMICHQCKTSYWSEPEDSLCYEVSSIGNVAIYEMIFKKAGRDPVNLKASIKCPKCPSVFVRQVRIGEDMKLFNVCVSCSHVWLYDT